MDNTLSSLLIAISLLLLIWLAGTLLWIIPYFYYPKKSKFGSDVLLERRLKLEDKKY